MDNPTSSETIYVLGYSVSFLAIVAASADSNPHSCTFITFSKYSAAFTVPNPQRNITHAAEKAVAADLLIRRTTLRLCRPSSMH
jgi:hypothetical protein